MTKKFVIIPDFPLPPSENACYKTVGRGGKVWRAQSQALREYNIEVDEWVYMNKEKLREVWDYIGESCRDGADGEIEAPILHVETYFCFQPERLYTKRGTVKRLDTSNRIKPTHDALSRVVGLDDRQFWTLHAEKLELESEESKECVLIKMIITKPRKASALKLLIHPPESSALQ